MVDFAPTLQDSNFSSLLKLQTPQRNFLINEPLMGDLLACEKKAPVLHNATGGFPVK